MNSTTDSNRFSKKTIEILKVAFGMLAVAAVGFITYKGVSSRGHIPPFPQVRLDSKESEKSLLDTASRAASFSPKEDELKLISMLEQLHLLETGEEEEEPTRSVETRTEELAAALKQAAKQNQERFLLLGDYLAVRFDSALKALLSQKPSKDETRSYAYMRVTLFSGAFYMRAQKSGLIAPDRTLKGSAALPEILFRFRWRLLAGLPGTLELTRFEQKALFDFTARFVDKQDVDRRLKAASKLAELDSTYDAVTAKALIRCEAGQYEQALAILNKATAAGRNDPAFQSFVRAVESNL